ncbi:hypothetical protein [Flammeovirga pacifica]|uniref:Uncharacterized protein n=1 Tax=Flammeovirga pacifica TaxID=915059 RepID=A0A1S1YUP6_FLAPC|nr:hypothetical protein [Flammeovirga pacifica]OHX64736.1 hypothetical protein NH26_24550 [Flammeovirga pacifica]
MKYIITLIFTTFSFSLFAQIGPFNHEQKAIPKKYLSQKKLYSLEQKVYDHDQAIKVLEMYLGYNKEGKTEYLYNYQSGEIELYINNQITKMEVVDYEITRELTNVYFILNDEIKLHATYYNSNGETVDIRSYQKDDETGEWNRVITDEETKRL